MTEAQQIADRTALKAELASLGASTEAGFTAGGDAVERIKVLATALEAANPTAAPARAGDLLRGRWRLIYSSFGLERETTLARLSFNVLPKTPVTVESIWQEVDPTTGLYDNVVDLGGGGMQVTLGRFAAADERRLDVSFFETVARTGGAEQRAAIDNAKLPPLHSDVTYLDDGFRLNRGSFGNLYVLQLVEREPARWSRQPQG